jgi:exoribonuclease-2
MERYWCLQYLIQEGFLEESKQEIHATVWRENLVRLDNMPYMTKVYGLPELKPGTRVSLQVQEVDTLMLDLRTKFVKVLEEADAPVDFDNTDIEGLDNLEPEVLDLNAVDANVADSASQDDAAEAA